MPNFKYIALSDSGALKSGHVRARSSAEARELLRGQGLFAMRIRRHWWDLRRGPEHALGAVELLSLSRELSTLLRGGVTLPSAITLLAETARGSTAQVLRRVRRLIEEGSSPAAAFSEQAEAFEPTFIQMVSLGERTGELSGVLERYTTYLRRQLAIRSKVRHASYYPVILLAVIAVAVSVLLLFSVPRFAHMYQDLGAQLPLVTRLLLSISNQFPLVVGLGISFGMVVYFTGKERFVVGLKRLPIVRRIFETYERAKIVRSFSILLESGMPAIKALESTADIMEGAAGEKLSNAARQIATGESLSQAMERTGLFTATGLRLIEVAQQTGTLPAQAASIADFYEEDLDTLLTKSMAIIEPLMILFMGIVVGAIVLGMYLPIFSLTAAVR